jgi:hypothetical protein
VSIWRIVDLAFLVVSILLLWFTLPTAVAGVRTFMGTSSRRQADVTGRATEPDADVVGRIGFLEGLGYHRLGETRTDVGDDAVDAWILAAADARTYAILVAGTPPDAGLTGFYSAWPDGTWLGTIHPRGTPLTFRSLDLRIDPRPLDLVESGHRLEAERLSLIHGQPREIRTMPDMLALEADYRVRFGGRELRPQVVRAVFPAAVGLFLLVASLINLSQT